MQMIKSLFMFMQVTGVLTLQNTGTCTNTITLINETFCVNQTVIKMELVFNFLCAWIE